MKHKTVAVVDIRSADVTALIGERGVNHSFTIKACETRDFLGFEKGVVLDEKAFRSQLKNAVGRAMRRISDPIDKITVGIPAEFLLVREKHPFLAFPQKKRVSFRDVDRLLNGVLSEGTSSYYSPMQRSVISFGLSDGSAVEDPVFRVSSSLSARIGFTYSSNYFCDLVAKALAPDEAFSVEFLPTPLAQGMFLLSEADRNNGTLFVDFDVYGTELLLMDGNAALAVATLPYGEATCLKRLSERYSTDDEGFLSTILFATNLFFFEADGPRTKTMNVNGENVYYYDVNETVYTVIDDVVAGIYSFLQDTQDRRKSISKIVIAGRGLPQIKGFREYLFRYLQIPVYEAKSPMPFYDKEICLSAYSLLDMAIDRSEKKYNDNLTFKFIK